VKLPIDISSPLISSMDDHSQAIYQRMYSGDMGRYESRLKAIGFVSKDRVLDAGCGFGQWSVALARLNRSVEAVEINRQKLDVLNKIRKVMRCDNIYLTRCSVDFLPFCSGSLDAIFSYSVVYNTDYVATLREFHRVLRSGGILYIGTNGPGWYLYNLICSHNPAINFNPRVYAVKSFINTVEYLLTGKYKEGKALVMFPTRTVQHMKEIGYKDIKTAGDGCINLGTVSELRPFYAEKYMGIINVFEVLAYK
jgi:ubiquinone/menaquinone biosynthesis C-methylase UbiE